MCESHIHKIMPFIMEGRDNCAGARLGGEQSCAALAGRNEGKLHRMSPERKENRRAEPLTVGRRPQGSRRGKPAFERRGLNGSRGSNASAGSAQAACQEVMFEEAGRSLGSGEKPNCCRKWQSHKGSGGLGEVGVAHSRVEVLVMSMDRRGGTWLAAHERGKRR
jgi:hypothetical protein